MKSITAKLLALLLAVLMVTAALAACGGTGTEGTSGGSETSGESGTSGASYTGMESGTTVSSDTGGESGTTVVDTETATEPMTLDPDADSASDFDYSISDGEVTIAGYKGNRTGVKIPNLIENLPVTSIGEQAFFFCMAMTSIKYRGTEEQWNAITKGDGVFSYCPVSAPTLYDYMGE